MVDHQSVPQIAPLKENGEFLTREAVPVFDEHEGSDGTVYDRYLLEQIAENCNERIRRSGDFCPLTLQHTTDDPSQFDPEVVGLAGNFRVEQFGREGRPAIVADFHYYKERAAEVLKRYPRRSVEIWGKDPEKRFFDPIALLGATTPRRDLGIFYAGEDGPYERYEMAAAPAFPGAANTYIPGASRKRQPMREELPSADIPAEKAKEIMRHGEVQGHELTEKQKGMFGAAAGKDDYAGDVDYPDEENEEDKPAGNPAGEGRAGVQPNSNPLDALGEPAPADRPPYDEDFDPSMLQGPLPPEALQQIATLVRAIVQAETSSLTRPVENPEPAMPAPAIPSMTTAAEAGPSGLPGPGAVGEANPEGLPPEPPAPAMGPFDTPEAGLPEPPPEEGFDPNLLQEKGPGRMMGEDLTMGAPAMAPGRMRGSCYQRENTMPESPADRYARERDEYREAYDRAVEKIREFKSANEQWRDRYEAVVKERDELRSRVEASEKESRQAVRNQRIDETCDKYHLVCDRDAEKSHVAEFTDEQFDRHLELMQQYQRDPVGQQLPPPAGERERPADSRGDLQQAREKYAARLAVSRCTKDPSKDYAEELETARQEAAEKIKSVPEPAAAE